MSQMAGVTLGSRYTLGRRIGTGGFSEVWQAHDAVLDRPVAIKLLHTEHARHADTLARFRNEAQLAARLSHEHIARVYDFFDSAAAQTPFLVMELVDGPSLADVLTRGPLDPARAMDIVGQVAAGLDTAHSAGLVHRDIKPGNIMLTRGGIVKITDFGLSHTLASAPITGTGMLIGTPAYLAPERTEGARATPASDLYALGVVGYECLAGHAPFSGPPLEVAMAQVRSPFPPLPPATPEPVAELIADLTAKDPACRPPSARVAAGRAADLSSWLTASLPTRTLPSLPDPTGTGSDPATLVTPYMPVASAPPPGPRRGRRARTAAIVIAASIAAVIAVAVAWAGPGTRPPAGAHGPSSAGTRGVRDVLVSRASLIGEPVRLAAQQLRAEGLRVRVIWSQSQAQPPARVIAVLPAGTVAPGSVVTLVAALPQGDGQQHDHQHGHGGGDGQGNQGN